MEAKYVEKQKRRTGSPFFLTAIGGQEDLIFTSHIWLLWDIFGSAASIRRF